MGKIATPARRAREYQLDALRWSDKVQHPGFFHDKRLGKCLIALRFLKRRKVNGPTLIVTTTSAFDGWTEDLEKERLNNFIELTGTKKQRQKNLQKFLSEKSLHKFVLLNKEGSTTLEEIVDVNWSSVILDESRFIANPKSNVSKFYYKHFRDVDHRIILTGTPDFKNKLDYFQQLMFLNHNNLPYKNFWDFRSKAFFNVAFDFIMKKHHNNILIKALAKNVHTLTRKELNIGRTKTFERRYVTLPPAVQKAYTTLENEYVLEYKGEEIKKSIYAPVAHNDLMRITGGHIDGKLVHREKVKDVKYLMENDLLNESIVIVCCYVEEILMLEKQLKKYNPSIIYGKTPRNQRSVIKREFNNGHRKLIIAMDSIIAHGFDLSGGETIIFYSQPKGEEIRSQVEDRIITVADEKQVLVVDILVKDTVDDDARKGFILGESQRDVFNRMVKRCSK